MGNSSLEVVEEKTEFGVEDLKKDRNHIPIPNFEPDTTHAAEDGPMIVMLTEEAAFNYEQITHGQSH